MCDQKEEVHKQEVDRLNSRIDYLEEKLKLTESQLSKSRREKIDTEVKFRDEKTQLESQVRDLTESLQVRMCLVSVFISCREPSRFWKRAARCCKSKSNSCKN